jgi:hypothetical protein
MNINIVRLIFEYRTEGIAIKIFIFVMYGNVYHANGLDFRVSDFRWPLNFMGVLKI